jgi:ankyrin repeat protein
MSDDNKEVRYAQLKEQGTRKFKERNWAEAVDNFTAACDAIYSEGETNPNRLALFVVCKNNAAQCAINLNNFTLAIELTSVILTLDPMNVKAFYRRGKSHLALDKAKEALDDFKSGQALDPDNKSSTWDPEINRAVEMISGKVNDALYTAVEEGGSLEKIEAALANGANIDFLNNKDGKSCLMVASGYGYREIVELLLDRGANINQKNFYHGEDTCLRYASENGHKDIVELLLNRGAIISAITSSDEDEFLSENGTNCLLYASEKGHIEIVELLLERGANVNVEEGNTPLMKASQNGYKEIAEMLLDRGANVNEKEFSSGLTSLMYASFCPSNHFEIVELLLSRGAHIDEKSNSGSNCLIDASKFGRRDMMEFLLNRGAGINECDIEGVSSLMHASKYGHKEIVETLLARGANISQKASEKGWTALFFASLKGCEETTEILLDRFANPNEKDNDGRTPLIVACYQGHKEVVKLLLVRGANICDKNNDGESALMYAYSQVNEIKRFDIHNMFNCRFLDAQDHLEIITVLRNWPVTMFIIAMKEIGLYCSLSISSLIDLFEFIGNEDDYIDTRW